MLKSFKSRKMVGLALALVLAVGGFLALTRPAVMAADNCDTAILNSDWCEPGDDGQGIQQILELVVNILSMGVGVLAILGIMICGFMYATAGGDEGKVKTAKTRILEIVIGLIVYALLYWGMTFLIPGFSTDSVLTDSTTSSRTEE